MARSSAQYIIIKKDCRVKVNYAKKLSNTVFILRAPVPCKTAWDIVSNCRAPSLEPTMVSTPDDFDIYFVKVAVDVFSNCFMLQADPVDFLPDLTTFHVLNSWSEVSDRDMVAIAKILKDSTSQTINGIYIHFLKFIIDLVAAPRSILITLCLELGVFPTA